MKRIDDPGHANRLRDYLLGGLSEAEREQIELRLLAEQDYYEQLLASEDELVDQYVRGSLPPGEKHRFEELILASPERQRDVRFARAWERYLASEAPAAQRASAPPAWRFLFATALIVLVIGAAALLLEVRRLRQDLDFARGQQAAALDAERKRGDRLAAELDAARQKTRRAAGVAAVFILAPGIVRDSSRTQKVAIPAGSEFVELELDVGDAGYKEYFAALSTLEGREIARADRPAVRARASGNVVVFRLVKPFPGLGDYSITLEGMSKKGIRERVAGYYFRVAR
jgi:hypothetical protein